MRAWSALSGWLGRAGSLLPWRRHGALARRLALAEAALAEAGQQHHALVEAMGVAVYTTDAMGRLISYNEAAAALWGWHPPLGDARWCGSWRLRRPDGSPLPHDECPMALALREGRPVRGAEAIAERPDGSRVPFLPHPTPLRDGEGRLVGAVNVLVDITGRRAAEAALAESEAWLRAVFETTPECIKLVAPDGTLLQMNCAGLRMVEATAPAQVEGRSVFGLIAPEHRAAWRANHQRVCDGEALSWEFDIAGLHGARRRMETHAAPLHLPDGRMAQLAITRDVTARRQAERQQVLLAHEVDHRAKNALAVALALVRLTRAEDPRRFAAAVEGRITALANAHALLSEAGWSGAALAMLAERELAPHLADGRVALHGPAVSLTPAAVQAVATVLHELASNATRHGALSAPDGRLDLAWAFEPAGGLRLRWTERGGPPLPEPPGHKGVGSRLIEATVRGQLGGAVTRQWEPAGLCCVVTIAADRLLPGAGRGEPASPPLHCRVLLAEDEPGVAQELREMLQALGCEVLGPAGTLEEVQRLAAAAPAGGIDVVVLGISLAGRPSFPAAGPLLRSGVPVIFTTGQDELPEAQAGQGVLLRKPPTRGELEAALNRVLAGGEAAALRA